MFRRYTLRKRGAFTLIEVLVVVVIISLLLAILVPSLRRARDQVRSTICRTRLRGIGTAIFVYLNGSDGHVFPHGENLGLGNDSGNEFRWEDPVTGEPIDPRHPEAYWGVAYKDYAERDDVFGCPNFVKVGKLIYDMEPELARRAGYGLNELFGRTSVNPKRGRKVDDIYNHSGFIIAHDHVEPCMEHGSRDMFHNDGKGTRNLVQYRFNGGRSKHYWGIFRHLKKDVDLDDQSNADERYPRINSNPNGLANILWLDGHVDSQRETTGDHISPKSYTGRRD